MGTEQLQIRKIYTSDSRSKHDLILQSGIHVMSQYCAIVLCAVADCKVNKQKLFE